METLTPYEKGYFDARVYDLKNGPAPRNPYLKGTNAYNEYNRGIAEYYKQRKTKEIY